MLRSLSPQSGMPNGGGSTTEHGGPAPLLATTDLGSDALMEAEQLDSVHPGG